MKIKSFYVYIIFFSLYLSVFVSCNTTNAVVHGSDSTSDVNEVKAPSIAKQYTNINIVPPPDSDESEEDKANRIKKAEEMKDYTINMTEEQRKFYYIKKTTDYEVIGEDLDYKIMVNHDTKELIIQFEESDSDQDWKNNWLFFPWPLKLDNKIVWTTRGYAKIYKSAGDVPINQFLEQIEKYPDYKVVIWGWSIGSAFAKIIARHLVIRTDGKIRIDELTTYGDVKCWYNPFYSVKNNCERIREYVTSNDAVTGCVPICRRDYTCRVGRKWDIRESGKSEYYHTHYDEYDYSEWE